MTDTISIEEMTAEQLRGLEQPEFAAILRIPWVLEPPTRNSSDGTYTAVSRHPADRDVVLVTSHYADGREFRAKVRLTKSGDRVWLWRQAWEQDGGEMQPCDDTEFIFGWQPDDC